MTIHLSDLGQGIDSLAYLVKSQFALASFSGNEETLLKMEMLEAYLSMESNY